MVVLTMGMGVEMGESWELISLCPSLTLSEAKLV